jgi:hypothetical protein
MDLAVVGPAGSDALGALGTAAMQRHHVGMRLNGAALACRFQSGLKTTCVTQVMNLMIFITDSAQLNTLKVLSART